MAPSRFSPQTIAPIIALSRKKREHAFHRQRLSDYWPEYLENKAQLVPNWNSIGMPVTTPTAKIETEDLCPESRGFGISLLTRAEGLPLPSTMNHASPIVSCGKEIVIDQRECELKPVPEFRIAQMWIHSCLAGSLAFRWISTNVVTGRATSDVLWQVTRHVHFTEARASRVKLRICFITHRAGPSSARFRGIPRSKSCRSTEEAGSETFANPFLTKAIRRQTLCIFQCPPARDRAFCSMDWG